jgi:type IV secretion system protein TrbC
MNLRSVRIDLRCSCAGAVIGGLPAPAYAAGLNMTREQPLNQIHLSVEGPVAKIVAVIIIITTGCRSRSAARPVDFAG